MIPKKVEETKYDKCSQRMIYSTIEVFTVCVKNVQNIFTDAAGKRVKKLKKNVNKVGWLVVSLKIFSRALETRIS
jgi:hypothetical protein